jgi:hypothetical protein
MIEYGALVGWYLQGTTKVHIGEPLCPPPILHGLAWHQTASSADAVTVQFLCCIETDLISCFISWFPSSGWHITVQLNDCTWSSGASEGVGVMWRYAPALWCQNAGRLSTEAGCQSEHRWCASCGQMSLQVSHWLYCKGEIQYYSSQYSELTETCFCFGISRYQMLEICAQFACTFRYFGFSVYFEHL